jgi:hypothetical protein
MITLRHKAVAFQLDQHCCCFTGTMHARLAEGWRGGECKCSSAVCNGAVCSARGLSWIQTHTKKNTGVPILVLSLKTTHSHIKPPCPLTYADTHLCTCKEVISFSSLSHFPPPLPLSLFFPVVASKRTLSPAFPRRT